MDYKGSTDTHGRVALTHVLCLSHERLDANSLLPQTFQAHSLVRLIAQDRLLSPANTFPLLPGSLHLSGSSLTSLYASANQSISLLYT